MTRYEEESRNRDFRATICGMQLASRMAAAVWFTLSPPTTPATGSGAGFAVKNWICYDVNAAAAVPPRDDERCRVAHRGIRSAGIVLAIGIVLEVVSTLSSFQKALVR